MIILVHHVESIWSDAMKRLGVCVEDYCDELRKFLKRNKSAQVILTRFEDGRLEDFHFEYGLAEFIKTVKEYSYGWEAGMLPEDESAPGGNHSEVVWIPDWIKALSGKTVHLCGMFDGECIEDITIALQYVHCKVVRVEKLIA